MTALPPPAEVAHLLLACPQLTPTPLTAYRTLVLPAESAALSKGDQASLVHARVLGYLLLYPPSQEARRSLLLEISSCQSADVEKQHEAVFELGAKYLKHFISIYCPEDLQRVPRDHSRAKASALVRDNYRCMVTGVPDMDAVSLNLTPASPDGDFTVTRCSYIFPEALGNMEIAGATAKPLQEHEAATVWTILQRFGYGDIRAELGSAASQGASLHRLENILTLDTRIHRMFDTFKIWFEAVEGQPHCYAIALAPGLGRPPFIPKRVQFVSHRPGLPLPSPRYLELHAACCRIAHLSGAAEYLDLYYSQMDDLQVLAANGASADVLSFALHRRLGGLDPD
ncbi:hypothetical protein FKP32DRAFT_1675063 [Trametes sanguinea]|nr:hypothetical protein FKP32DRAFT_1675063 [Trametes sanguinea]